jgi:hypothetical protein
MDGKSFTSEEVKSELFGVTELMTVRLFTLLAYLECCDGRLTRVGSLLPSVTFKPTRKSCGKHPPTAAMLRRALPIGINRIENAAETGPPTENTFYSRLCIPTA